MYCVKQNVLLQGTTKEVGNLCQLVKLIESMCEVKHSLPIERLSHQMQNEFIQLLAKEVSLHNLNILKCNKWFNCISDEAMDYSNNTLLSLVHITCSNYFDVD